jgi:hypothetical protein
MPDSMANRLTVGHGGIGVSVSYAVDLVLVLDAGDSSSRAMSADQVNRTYTGTFGHDGNVGTHQTVSGILAVQLRMP